MHGFRRIAPKSARSDSNGQPWWPVCIPRTLQGLILFQKYTFVRLVAQSAARVKFSGSGVATTFQVAVVSSAATGALVSSRMLPTEVFRVQVAENSAIARVIDGVACCTSVSQKALPRYREPYFR